ncbi:MAG: two-component system, NarL family, sensor histidine kinase BarA [Blastocatellia bacterium]|nr:two-component system, NarL family, sensor histidine kinase BarA [Blastocatellia bacterium]
MQPIAQPQPAMPEEEGNDRGFTIDELRKQNDSLEEQNRKLKQAADYRSAFLARLAHELRTPLTSILGFSEILLTQEDLTEAQQGFCARIQNSAQQLQVHLNQLSDLSRLEAGQSSLQREEFSLEDLVQESCAALEQQAQRQNAEIRCEVDATLPMIVSDRGKLRQALFNFLAYAITRSPGALVVVSAEKDSAGFLLKIEDEGESPVDCTAFVELDSSNRRAGSSELGLAIARQNIDLLGASLRFQNREPRGLQVVIQLPNNPPDAPR